MTITRKPNDAHRLALAFAKAVREELGDHLDEINRLNASDEYVASGCCATHNYCDANMLMLGAFEDTFRRQPAYLDGADAEGNHSPEAVRDIELWNDAWKYAAEDEFAEPDEAAEADIAAKAALWNDA